MIRHQELLSKVEQLAAAAADSKQLMQRVADYVHSVMPRYNSVSFRVIDEVNPRTLILGPYTGSFTPQQRIPYGQGLGGTAAVSEKTIVVNSVADDSRYLSASTMVKSEMVVPIFVRGKFTGIFDIQSYFVDTFKNAEDRSFVESCAQVIGRFMEMHTAAPSRSN